MFLCNVIVQDLGGGQIEVAAIGQATSMEQVRNPALKIIAESVTGKFQRIISPQSNNRAMRNAPDRRMPAKSRRPRSARRRPHLA